MKDHLNGITRRVHEITVSEVAQDRILRIVPHIVGYDRGPLGCFACEHRALESNLDIVWEQLFEGRHATASGRVDEALREVLLKVTAGCFEVLESEVVLQGCYVQALRGRSRDDESHNRGWFWHRFKPLVKLSEGLDEDIHPFVQVLVAPAREEIQGSVEIERVARKEVTHDELMNPFLVLEVEVLKLVQRRELVGIKPVRKHEVRLSAEEMLGFARGYLAHRREDVRGVRCRSLNRILAPDRVVARGLI
ncbi:MAG: hypothetical protein RL518_2729, partial [Pseudomonadota bacterium]